MSNIILIEIFEKNIIIFSNVKTVISAQYKFP